MTIGISSQVNNKFVSDFKTSEGRYVLETSLAMDKNSYYVVASINGDSRRSQIVSAVIVIQGVNDNPSKNLDAGDLRSVE